MGQRSLKNIQPNKIFLLILTILIVSPSLPTKAETPKYILNKEKKFGYIRVGKSEVPPPEIKTEKEKASTKSTEKNDSTNKNKASLTPPWRLDAGLRIAEIEIVSGKYTQAIKTLKKVLRRHPANTDAYTYIGYSYMKLGMLDKAEKNLEYAINMSPDHMGAHLYTGLLYLKKDKPQIALESLQALRIICNGMICNEENYLADKIDSYESDKKRRKDK